MTEQDWPVNPGVDETPADSGTAATTSADPAEGVTAEGADSPSVSGEEEHLVPLKHILDERRRRAEAERERDEFRDYTKALSERVNLFEAARPEIERIVNERARLEAENRTAMERLKYLERVEALAKEHNLELPDREKYETSQLLSGIAARLDKLEDLPRTVNQSIQQLQAQTQAAQQEAASRAMRDKAIADFTKQWADITAQAPQLDDFRDVAFEKWVKDGASKPVSAYFNGVVTTAKSTQAARQAAAQVAQQATPRTAVAGSQGAAQSAPKLPPPTTFSSLWEEAQKKGWGW